VQIEHAADVAVRAPNGPVRRACAPQCGLVSSAAVPNDADPDAASASPSLARESEADPHAAVEAGGLVRRFGAVTALDQVSLTVRRGEFFSLLGPSGCGKTTLLRLIAGLDLPDSGWLKIAGADALGVPAYRRPVNTVFQSYALFPHLDVWNNVAFGLRMKRVPREAVQVRVQRALELVQITDLAERHPAQLSGGQRQRVALARAVVNEPAVLLLDEPLGALDLQLRRQLQVELRALQRRLGLTFIHVTHDQDEALTMSDRVAVMQAGRIVQLGPPAELYARPRTRFVASFLGECNLLSGTAHGDDPVIETPLGRLRVASFIPVAPILDPSRVTLAIRPERVRLCRPDGGLPKGTNQVPVTLSEAVYSGPETHYVCHTDAGAMPLRARVMNADAGPAPFRLGEHLLLELPPDALVRLED